MRLTICGELRHLLLFGWLPTLLSGGGACAQPLQVDARLGGDAQTLLQRADAALYAGKLAGRQCLQRARPAAATA